MNERQFEISLKFDGSRLDNALRILYPEESLRARRRLWETMEVRVQGRVRPPAYRVRTGQRVEVVEVPASRSGIVHPPDLKEGVHIVTRTSMFAALYKPGMLHSVRGKMEGCVEAMLPTLFAGEEPFLLNRLDFLTSGLVMVGFQPESLDWYAGWQDEGLVTKLYLARVHGRLEKETVVTRAIDSSRRRKVHVVAAENRDPIRHTTVTPLAYNGNEDTTLVRAEIRKGQRHQIRAHLASLGHPIAGDPLYGPEKGETTGARIMYLHHYKLLMPDFEAECPPAWSTDAAVWIPVP